jgi:hypothetical protein
VIGGLLIVASSAAEAGWLGSDKPKPVNILTINPPMTEPRTRLVTQVQQAWMGPSG